MHDRIVETRARRRGRSWRRAWARSRCWAIPVIVLLSITLPHLGQGTWQGDSALYSALGLQGWRTGHLWSLMTQPGVPYLKKPPLPIWVHGLSLHLLGPTLWASRLPTVLAACGCVLAMVAIARTMLGRWASLMCGLVLALTYDFFHRAGGVSLDVWQLLFMLVAVAMASRAAGRNRPPWLVGAGVPLGLGLMCKPFMALLAVPLLAVWLVWTGRGRWLGWLGLATVLAIAVAAPWHVSMYAIYGRPFIDEYLGHEVVQRAMGEVMPGHDRPEPVWFYAGLLVTRYWPWMAALVAALVLVARRRTPWRDTRLASLAIVWGLGWLIALSGFPDRRDRYDVPLFLGTSLLAGAWLASGAPPSWRRPTRRVAGALTLAAPILGGVLAAAPVDLYSSGNGQWERLGEWVRGERAGVLWNGGAGMIQCAEGYLVSGVWPRTAGGGPGPSAGSLILYHADGALSPGPRESPVFEHGDVKVTRLEGIPWQPVFAMPHRFPPR